MGQQTAPPGTKGRSILQAELSKSDLDRGEAVLLECSPGTRVLGTEEDEGHQAAGHSQALDRASHTSSSIPRIEVTLSLSHRPEEFDYKTRH